MATKTISQLSDGKTIINSTALIEIEQGGNPFNSSVRPNPENQSNVINQAQLEANLNANLEIPDSDGITVVYDKSFTQTKSFKIGLASFLEAYVSTINTNLIYTDSGALFKNINSSNLIASCLIHDLTIISGIPTNSVFDLHGNTSSALNANNVNFVSFDSLGILDVAFVIARFSTASIFNKGLIVLNPQAVIIDGFLITQVAPTGATFLSIKTNFASNVVINSLRALSFFSGDSLLFLDPNSPVNTIFTITNSEIIAGDFYQQGVKINISSISNSGGMAVYNTATNHNLSVGNKIKHSGFGTVLTSNGSKIVTVIGSSTSYTTGDIFDITDTGILENRPVNVISVADNGSGKTRFTTAISHGLQVGKMMVLKTFSTYNQTAVVTAVDTPITGTTFDCDIVFTGTEIGLVDAASLDQTDPRVHASSNRGQQQSMIQGELLVNTSGITVQSSPSTPVPIEDLTPNANDFTPNPENELMTLNTTTGGLRYDGLEIVRVVPTYTIAATPESGGSQILEFALFRDSGAGFTEVPNTRITFDTSVDIEKSFSGTFFNMNPQDNFKLFKVSNTTSNDTDISDKTKLMLLSDI